MKNTILILFCFLCINSIFGQKKMINQKENYIFVVLAINDGIILKNFNQKIIAGEKLQANDEIILGGNDYIALLHYTGQYIELSTTGIHKITELSKNILQKNPKDTSRIKFVDFVEYVANELSKISTKQLNKDYKTHICEGSESVKRCNHNPPDALGYFEQEEKNNSENINITRMKNTFYDDFFFLRIYPNVHQKKNISYTHYVICIMDMTNKVVFYDEIQKNVNNEAVTMIDFSKLKYKYEPAWIIHILPKTRENIKNTMNGEKDNIGSYSIFKLSPEYFLYGAVKQKLARNAPNSKTAPDFLMQAMIFEEEKLILDAFRCYSKMIELQPNVKTYQILYQEFIIRNNLGLSHSTKK